MVLLGGLGSLVPQRRWEIAELGLHNVKLYAADVTAWEPPGQFDLRRPPSYGLAKPPSSRLAPMSSPLPLWASARTRPSSRR